MQRDPATVSAFRLDKYLVTVARYRRFLTAWNGGADYTPPAGSGKHAHLNGGRGLVSGSNGSPAQSYEPGWIAADDTSIQPMTTPCDPYYATWTASPGRQENLPINCVNWYEAYAFCIWDGGFLPSEAEWEYAAAGGMQEREYPWGSAYPGSQSQYAIYGCYYPTDTITACTGVSNIAPVGTATLGAGLWGQLDLAGNLWEWTLDWLEGSPGSNGYVNPCVDCAVVAFPAYPGPPKVIRGGAHPVLGTQDLFPPYRAGENPQLMYADTGFRCARPP
jgi:formylglycine-generating enzyme required for sulfatase activity